MVREGQETKLLGFLVVGTPPPPEPDVPKTDAFELKQAAIECADRLHGLGWTRVACSAVLREECGTPYEREVLKPIWKQPR